MTLPSDRMTLALIPVEKVLWHTAGWDEYSCRWRVDAGNLLDAVRRLGVIDAVTVEDLCEGYRLISGFRRIAAAREVGIIELPAAVYASGALSAKEAFLAALAANAGGATLSDADRAVALARGRDLARMNEEELVGVAAPLLGLASSHKVVREYLEIASLPACILDALQEGRISRQHAEAVLLVAADDREWFFKKAVLPLRLSASDTRLVASAALDLAAREKRPFAELLSQALAASAEKVGESPQEAKAALKEALSRRLSPLVTGMQDEFDALASALRLPAGAKVAHSPGFESDEIEIAAKVPDEAALRALKNAIERGLESGAFERMFSIARRKADDISLGLSRRGP